MMMLVVGENGKSALRQKGLRARRALSGQELLASSEAVEKNLLSMRAYVAAKTIACYVAKEDEVQTKGLIERSIAARKRVLVPATVPHQRRLLFFEIRDLGELSPGHFGVLEPVRRSDPIPLEETDMVLVPLVAWDGRGHRLGYGKGYFDAALAHRGRALAVGLALESQRVESIPQASWDVSLDAIVTERRVLRFTAMSDGGPRDDDDNSYAGG